ncbi:DUF3108 domain-containing protein [Chitinibacteraceae bacterium HSL-7]
MAVGKPRRWLLVAFVLSLAVHLFGLSADSMLHWADRVADAPELKLKPTSRQLTQLDTSELALPPELQGVTPAEQLTLFAAPPPTAHAAPVEPTPAPAPEPVATPSPVIATTPKPARPTPEPAAPVVTPVAATPTAAPIAAPSSATMVASAPTAVSASAPTSIVRRKGFPKSADITLFWGPIPATLHWRVDNGRYRSWLKVSMFGKTRELSSEGIIVPGRLHPERYTDLRNEALRGEASFDWQAKTVTLNDRGTLTTHPLAEGDQDLFSAAFEFAMFGLPDGPFSLYSGRKRYDNITFELKGESELTIGDQRVTVLLIAGEHDGRRFEFWLAPDWYNLPVRLKADDTKNGASYDVWAGSITIDGETVLKPVARNDGNKRP